MQIRQRIKNMSNGQRGIGMAETLVAVAILGTAVAAFTAALATGSLSVGAHETETIAQRLAQNQLEYIKNTPFDPGGTYPALDAPQGYTVTILAGPVADTDDDMQKITVTILHEGSDIFEAEGYKANR